jgi:hypothetical protein
LALLYANARKQATEVIERTKVAEAKVAEFEESLKRALESLTQARD